jgi:acyl dehydratase
MEDNMALQEIAYDKLEAWVGKEIGVSDWHEVTQEEINAFADCTHDHQWIHVDPERAKQSPFGGPIAHGYYTLSLAPYLLAQVLDVPGLQYGLNYGLNKLRFPSPVMIGSRLRLRATCLAVDEVPGGKQATVELSFETEGSEKPAAVAQALYRYYP